jgi:hypothetical protein
MTTTTPRYCEHCGAPLVQRPQEANTLFAVRRFCSRACGTSATRALRPPDWVRPPTIDAPRTCTWCGGLYFREPHVSSSHFASRRFCGNECAAAARSANCSPVCECGAPVTTTVYVVQLSSDGTPYNTGLHVCAACAPQIAGGSPVPHVITDATPSFGWRDGERKYHHQAGRASRHLWE